MTRFDPVVLTLYRHRFEGIAEEMGSTLQRTSFSPNIKERLDFSCALFDARGQMIAQAAHIPVHLGAMPASVEAALATITTWQKGDVVILNDPFRGGTHLPDITLVSPVFNVDDRDPLFFVASRAHHADVGGMTPGSLPLSTSIYQEGLIIPPVKLIEQGIRNEGVWALLMRNVRTPRERAGDLDAQLAAHQIGTIRLRSLVDEHGVQEVIAYADHLLDYSESLIRHAIGSWPDGTFASTDYLEGTDDTLIPISVQVRVDDEDLTIDFAGSAAQTASSLNAVRSITCAACYYVIRSLTALPVPMNAGCFRPLTIATPEQSIVNAVHPAAVAAGNVETSQRIVDVLFGALAQALPSLVPAASQGTMNNLTIGGTDFDGQPFAYYETIGGGMGASAQRSGLDGVQVHMTNTLNTPIEALEHTFPFRIHTYALRSNSGGEGLHTGGEGIIRAYTLLKPCEVTLLSERRTKAPWGLQGGNEGSPGKNSIVHPNGSIDALPAKFSKWLPAGAILRIETPGGGGWGIKNG